MKKKIKHTIGWILVTEIIASALGLVSWQIMDKFFFGFILINLGVVTAIVLVLFEKLFKWLFDIE